MRNYRQLVLTGRRNFARIRESCTTQNIRSTPQPVILGSLSVAELCSGLGFF